MSENKAVSSPGGNKMSKLIDLVMEKPKRRSLVERELVTNMTARVTSPVGISRTTNNPFRRSLNSKQENDHPQNEKSVTDTSLPVSSSPINKMYASNSPSKKQKLPKTNIVAKNNIGLIIPVDNNNPPAKKFDKKNPKSQKDSVLIQNSETEPKSSETQTTTIIISKPSTSRNLNNSFEQSPETSAPVNSKEVKPAMHIQSSKITPPNGLLVNNSVVKTLDFDSKKKDINSKPENINENDILKIESESEHQLGDLAWARVGTYPFWPCMVTRDPSGPFAKKKLFGRVERYILHVTFFGDNGRRGWVADNMVRKFLGIKEFLDTRDNFTPENKKKDRGFYNAFFISEKKQGVWDVAVKEAESLLNTPKELRMDLLNEMIHEARLSKIAPKSVIQPNIPTEPKPNDLSLSESLYDTLFSEDDSKDGTEKAKKSRKNSLDVSEVVTACLDNMAAKTGLSQIQKQSHMDRWLQKAKSNTPEKCFIKTIKQITPNDVRKETKAVSSQKTKRLRSSVNSTEHSGSEYVSENGISDVESKNGDKTDHINGNEGEMLNGEVCKRKKKFRNKAKVNTDVMVNSHANDVESEAAKNCKENSEPALKAITNLKAPFKLSTEGNTIVIEPNIHTPKDVRSDEPCESPTYVHIDFYANKIKEKSIIQNEEASKIETSNHDISDIMTVVCESPTYTQNFMDINDTIQRNDEHEKMSIDSINDEDPSLKTPEKQQTSNAGVERANIVSKTDSESMDISQNESQTDVDADASQTNVRMDLEPQNINNSIENIKFVENLAVSDNNVNNVTQDGQLFDQVENEVIKKKCKLTNKNKHSRNTRSKVLDYNSLRHSTPVSYANDKIYTYDNINIEDNEMIDLHNKSIESDTSASILVGKDLIILDDVSDKKSIGNNTNEIKDGENMTNKVTDIASAPEGPIISKTNNKSSRKDQNKSKDSHVKLSDDLVVKNDHTANKSTDMSIRDTNIETLVSKSNGEHKLSINDETTNITEPPKNYKLSLRKTTTLLKPEIINTKTTKNDKKPKKFQNKGQTKNIKSKESIDKNNSEFLKYFELKRDTVLEENPQLSEEDLLEYLYNTWLYEDNLKTDEEKTGQKEQANLIKGLDREKKKKMPKKKFLTLEAFMTIDKTKRKDESEQFNLVNGTEEEQPMKSNVKNLGKNVTNENKNEDRTGKDKIDTVKPAKLDKSFEDKPTPKKIKGKFPKSVTNTIVDKKEPTNLEESLGDKVSPNKLKEIVAKPITNNFDKSVKDKPTPKKNKGKYPKPVSNTILDKLEPTNIEKSLEDKVSPNKLKETVPKTVTNNLDKSFEDKPTRKKIKGKCLKSVTNTILDKLESANLEKSLEDEVSPNRLKETGPQPVTKTIINNIINRFKDTDIKIIKNSKLANLGKSSDEKSPPEKNILTITPNIAISKDVICIYSEETEKFLPVNHVIKPNPEKTPNKIKKNISRSTNNKNVTNENEDEKISNKSEQTNFITEENGLEEKQQVKIIKKNVKVPKNNSLEETPNKNKEKHSTMGNDASNTETLGQIPERKDESNDNNSPKIVATITIPQSPKSHKKQQAKIKKKIRSPKTPKKRRVEELSNANIDENITKENMTQSPGRKNKAYHDSSESVETKTIPESPKSYKVSFIGSENSMKLKIVNENSPKKDETTDKIPKSKEKIEETKSANKSGSTNISNPEFLKYFELKKDEILDENPHITENDLLSYLYKTWLYEENLKTDIEKSDELEQANLIKGIDEDQQPKKLKKKLPRPEKTKDNLQKKLEAFFTKEKSKRNIAKAYYNEDDTDLEDEIAMFEIPKPESEEIDMSQPIVNELAPSFSPQKVKSGQNEILPQESQEPLLPIDEQQFYLDQMLQPKPNIFKGLIREKVCEICEKVYNLIKCKGCHGMFHVDCVKNMKETIETEQSALRTKKKKRGRKPKNASFCDENDDATNSTSDENNVSLELKEPNLVINLDEFESQFEAKMAEILKQNIKEPIVLDRSESCDWTNTVPGKCEIIDIKPKPKPIEMADFKCHNCQKYDTPVCFVCKSALSPKNNEDYRQRCQVPHCFGYYHLECLDMWPQTQFNAGQLTKCPKSSEKFEAITCPRHVCHTCVCDDPRGCKTRFSSDKLAKCVRCPATYHSFTKCLPAGTKVLSASYIICPRHYEIRPGKVPCHVNTGWCFICALGGTLICCEYCPTSFHAECLNIKPPEGSYMCEDCETGRLPLYGEMVWVKLGHYRWWPGLVLHPCEIPENILAVKHSLGEFVVRFFGQYDYYWVNRGRVFPFQEGDSGRISSQKSKLDEAFTVAITHAKKAFDMLKEAQPNSEEDTDIASSLLPPHYVKLKVNKPVGSLTNWRTDDEDCSLTLCECDPNEEEPCGMYSQCLNRMLLTECGPSCRAGDRCHNRAFERRQYPRLQPYRTPHRGWGLKTTQDIKQGEFVIEYVGELIDMSEFQRRMGRKHEMRDENYYFLTLDKDRMIDAGPKGNLARFMNHCCEPNCETQKWTVLGDVRVGLFAIRDIPANSEVTFNYNLECAGIEKKRCMCGARRCSGYIGAKPKQDEPPPKTKRTYKKRKQTETPSPTTVKKKIPRAERTRTKETKPKELTEIEKDLLIIKMASSASTSGDCKVNLETIEVEKDLKRKLSEDDCPVTNKVRKVDTSTSTSNVND